MSLPTYTAEEEKPGLNKTVPPLFAPYLDRVSLLHATVACKDWNAALGQYLWSDPIKFIAETKIPYGNANRFFRRSWNQKALRERVSTLDFRPLKYKGYPYDYAQHAFSLSWTFSIAYLQFYPNARFVILDGREGSDYDLPRDITSVDITGTPTKLLLFSAQKVPSVKTTFANGLSLRGVVDSMFIDLSYAHDGLRWSSILSERSFQNLRVLKLRGLRLTDAQMPKIAWNSNHRLWSLDIRDNSLTDHTILYLLHNSFLESLKRPGFDPFSEERLYEDPPSYQEHDEEATNIPLRPDTISAFTKYIIPKGTLEVDTTQVLPSNDPLTRATGITHLYLSGNSITSDGIDTLLRSTNRLQCLEVGSTRLPPWRTESNAHNRTSYCLHPATHTHLLRTTGTQLEVLSIHHSLITATATLVQDNLSNGYIPSKLRAAEWDSLKDNAPNKTAWNPLHNFRLHTLTLTSIPTKSYGPTIDRLTTFLRLCAEQERILLSIARTSYRRAPQPLLGMRHLTLEFVNEASSADEIGPSVSGDADADEFHAQAADDFSFFDNDQPAPSRPTSLKRAHSAGGGKNGVHSLSTLGKDEELKDVYEELKAFREKDTPKWSGQLKLVFPKPDVKSADSSWSS